MSKKILITGANGQLGKALFKRLKNQYTVYPMPRSLEKSSESFCSYYLDITDRKSVSIALRKIQPDIIINCAAYTNVDRNEDEKYKAHNINVKGLQNLIQASSSKSYFIQISTDYVFKGDDGPYSEKDRTFPVNYYGKTKLEAENLLIGSRRKYLIFRPNVLYSGDLECKGNFFSWIYTSLLKNKPIYVVDDQISNPTFLPFFTETIFRCMNLNLEGVFHCGSDDYISRYEFAILVAKKFNMQKELINSISTKELTENNKTYIAKRPLHSGLKIDKLEEYLDYPAYSTDYNLQIIKNYFTSA